jgi:hypothetical protein
MTVVADSEKPTDTYVVVVSMSQVILDGFTCYTLLAIC